VSQKATQKQTTIVKIDNRRQVRQRSNAVSTAPPPVLRGVSAIQPIIPLPPAPDLYESNVLRQRVERLERVREPIRASTGTSTGIQTEAPIRASTGIQTEAPIRASTGIQTETPEQRLGGNRQTSRLLELPFSRQTQTEAPVAEQRLGGERERSILLDLPAPQGELETDSSLIPIPTSGRFSELRDRMRLRPVEDTPFRREEPIVEEPDIPLTYSSSSVSSEEPPPTEQLEEPIEEPMARDIAIRRPRELQSYIDTEPYRVLVRGKSLELYGRVYDNLLQSEKNRVRAEVRQDVISGSI